MSSLAKAYNPNITESKWHSFWEEHKVFRADPHSERPPFCIIIPPPNVTGVLHMGHALVNTLLDVLLRFHRMEGFETLGVPGTDHAGIATQAVVERYLLATTGRKRRDFTREEFLAHVWQWKEKSEQQITHQLKTLGCSCDWSALRFTMDERSNRAVRTVFCKFFEEGLIYRGNYLVNWDPVTQTALADDEVEEEERDGFIWYIRYPGVDHEGIVVATTRPETLFGDVAVAVHPTDERYQHLIGKELLLPLTHYTITIVADASIAPEFGTGAVKVTPAHDFDDYARGQRHHLPMRNILHPNGTLNAEAGRWEGMLAEEAREAVVEALREEGLLLRKEPHRSRIGISYRSGAVVQPYLSEQWFLKVTQFKETLKEAVRSERVKLVPPHWKQTYEHWIDNLRDWCISRQIWWGHRIPIWYNKETKEKLCCAEEGIPPEVMQNPDAWEQDPDVLDTWFSSALWPFSALGWPEKTPELKKFYPTQVLVTGHDILFFWVARMILMGEHFMKEVPFHETFLHGLIYGKSYWRQSPEGSVAYVTPQERKEYDLTGTVPKDVYSKWEKMSKSKGNALDPLEVIQEYGTDALRMTLCASTTYARQIDLDTRRFEEYKNFINKVWNGARFVLMSLENPLLSREEMARGLDLSLLTLEDRWLLSRFNRSVAEARDHIQSYAFDRLATGIYAFYWDVFCARYVELVKPVLHGKRGSEALRINRQKILAIVLMATIRLLHPVAPFLTEELFAECKRAVVEGAEEGRRGVVNDPYTQDFFAALRAKSCAVAPYPKVYEESSKEVEDLFEHIFELVTAVRNIRMQMQFPAGEKTDLYVAGPEEVLSIVEEHREMLLALTPTEQIHFLKNETTFPVFGSVAPVGGITLMVPLSAALREKEKERLEKERVTGEKQKASLQARLANQEFQAKAPPKVLQELIENLRKIEEQLKVVEVKLSELRRTERDSNP